MKTGSSKALLPEIKNNQMRLVDIWYFVTGSLFRTIKIEYDKKGNFLDYKIYDRYI